MAVTKIKPIKNTMKKSTSVFTLSFNLKGEYNRTLKWAVFSSCPREYSV